MYRPATPGYDRPMPVDGQRDPEQVKTVLEGWLDDRLDHPEGGVEITELVIPQSSGFSNETFLLEATWLNHGKRLIEELVLRSQPQVYAVFPDIDLINQQYRTMELLGEHSDVPVARTRWAEPDASVLGQPFFVMDRLHGQVPGDVPPWTVDGFVIAMNSETRREWHRNGVEAMCRVPKVDWRAVGFDYLDLAHYGTLGPEQRQGYLRHFKDWALADREHPILDPAWEWLLANWPDDSDRIELCWGDARPGNQMSQGTEIVGVFDWEVVSLGNPESDLGWWLFLQRFHTEGIGVPLPEGLLDKDATVAWWEELMDRPATNVDFYEALAGFHFGLVMCRISDMRVLLSPDEADSNMFYENPVASLTAKLVGL